MCATRTAPRRGAPEKDAAKTSVRPPGRAGARARKPTQRDETVRRRIVRAAAEIYRECGYERAGMTAIARRVGMTAPALYWYFRSKEEILLAFLEHTIADLIQHVQRFVHAHDPGQRLWQFVHAYALWQLQQQELSAAYERIYALGHLRNSLPEKQRRRVTALERTFYGMCRDLIADVQGRPRNDKALAPVAFAVIGMVEHLIAWFRLNGAMSVEQIAALYADLAVAMAAGRARGKVRTAAPRYALA